MNQRVFILHPERSHYFWNILFGVLLIPLFGIGLYLLYKVHINRRDTEYQLSDRAITAITPERTSALDLASVQSIDLEESATDKWFSLGTLIIKSGTKTIQLKGIKKPASISDIILASANRLRAELESERKAKQQKPPMPPGVMDKMDYLTGLWQQGLISNEDYDRERKYFED